MDLAASHTLENVVVIKYIKYYKYAHFNIIILANMCYKLLLWDNHIQKFSSLFF